MVDSDDTKRDVTANDVYILHFQKPYWTNARHYVGYTTKGVAARVEKHRDGRGSLLVDYALNKKGVDFLVGRVEHYDTAEQARWREIRLKDEKHLSRHCSICNEEKAKCSSH